MAALRLRLLSRRLTGRRLPALAGAALIGAAFVGALRAYGQARDPGLGTPGEVALATLVISAVTTYLTYPILFRSEDLPFLRGLGLSPRTLYAERCVSLVAVTLGVGALVGVAVVAAGAPLPASAGILSGVALLTAGSAAWLHARAAARVVGEGTEASKGLLARSLHPSLRSIAPLVFATPATMTVAIGGATVAARLALLVSPVVVWGAAMAGGLVLLARGAAPYRNALPRFLGKGAEMAWSPPPPTGETGLVVRGGVWRLLPRRVAALRARDAAVVGRRHRWVYRVTAPAAIVAFFVLLRGRGDPGVAGWVVLGGGTLLALQTLAVTSLIRHEAAEGVGWLDRSLGVGRIRRGLARGACAVGATAPLATLLGLFWWWGGAPGAGGWWLLAAAAAGGMAAVPTVAASHE